MEAETVSLADQIHKEIVAEIDRRQQRYFHGEQNLQMKMQYRWFLKGSAGQALRWFDEIANAKPNATRDELGKMLEYRIKMERASHGSQWFTASHLKGVLAIVKGTYNYDEA